MKEYRTKQINFRVTESEYARISERMQEPEEQEEARRNLLKYCELDTLAMVKVWEELKKV